MKKLLTLFSAFVLGSGSTFGVASCTARPKEDPLDGHQDFAILNQIKAEVNMNLIQTFEAWWNTKATIDINETE